MADKPLWRKAYDAVERPVGSRLEQVVQTEQFADGTGLALRLRAEVNRRIERTTRSLLHRVNLPAATDVARLREQVSDLHRTVRRLDDALREERAQVQSLREGRRSGEQRAGEQRPGQQGRGGQGRGEQGPDGRGGRTARER